MLSEYSPPVLSSALPPSAAVLRVTRDLPLHSSLNAFFPWLPEAPLPVSPRAPTTGAPSWSPLQILDLSVGGLRFRRGPLPPTPTPAQYNSYIFISRATSAHLQSPAAHSMSLLGCPKCVPQVPPGSPLSMAPILNLGHAGPSMGITEVAS